MAERDEGFVNKSRIAEGSDLARQARHDRNFQGADPTPGNDAQVEPGWGSTSRSHRPRRHEQGRLCLSIGTLQLLANRIAWNGSVLGNVWRKLYHRGITGEFRLHRRQVSNRRNGSHGYGTTNALLQTRRKVWPRRYHHTVSGKS